MPLIQRRHSCIYFGKPQSPLPLSCLLTFPSPPFNPSSSFLTSLRACLDERLRRGTSGNRVWFGTADYWHKVYWNISLHSFPHCYFGWSGWRQRSGEVLSHVSKQGAFKYLVQNSPFTFSSWYGNKTGEGAGGHVSPSNICFTQVSCSLTESSQCHQTKYQLSPTLVKYSEKFTTIFNLKNAGTNKPHP